MSKGIIIYRSKYGAAKKYAGWMMEKTGFDLAEMKMACLLYTSDAADEL